MEARAIARKVGMSARKMRLVVDQIRGQDVNDAYAILRFSKKAAASPIDKVLRSAVANAVYRADETGEVLDVDDLYVKRRTWTRVALCVATARVPMVVRRRSGGARVTSP